MPVHALTLTVELRLPAARSLKDKRAVVRPLLDGARRRLEVAAAETDRQDDHHRAQLAFSTVSGSMHQAVEVTDAVERFVWSFPEVEVLDCDRSWLETV